MILEGIVTTLNADETVNISPMGPLVDGADFSEMTFRPFHTSRTLENLKRNGEGVFHVTDNVEMIASAAIDAFSEPPALERCCAVNGWILRDTCRWHAFRVVEVVDEHPRCRMHCQVVEEGKHRDFFGFNRAKHAVVEAAILATRTHVLPPDEILGQLSQLKPLVDKTAGPQEERAFAMLCDYVERALAAGTSEIRSTTS